MSRPDLKLTGGLRWTDDKKHFIDIPSELLAGGYGYPIIERVNQEWQQVHRPIGRQLVAQARFHRSDAGLRILRAWLQGRRRQSARRALCSGAGVNSNPIHPLTFKPEFIDAYELGTKNTLVDGGMTLNGDVFFYNYKGYQISRIVDRTAINQNFDATVKGAEVEAMYEPIPGLKFNFAGGYEDTRINNGQSSIDLMDRTAGHPGWVVIKPFVPRRRTVSCRIMSLPYWPARAPMAAPGSARCVRIRLQHTR